MKYNRPQATAPQQRGIQLLEFWPQHLLDKALRPVEYDGLAMHPWMTVWAHAVAPTTL
jgi:hypothetical protein